MVTVMTLPTWSPLLRVLCHILESIQATSWRVFRTTVTKSWVPYFTFVRCTFSHCWLVNWKGDLRLGLEIWTSADAALKTSNHVVTTIDRDWSSLVLAWAMEWVWRPFAFIIWGIHFKRSAKFRGSNRPRLQFLVIRMFTAPDWML